MNEDFSLGKMSADARLTATFKYYEKTEQNRKIVITALSGQGRCSETQPWIRLGRK